jgi:four helix bundle protein
VQTDNWVSEEHSFRGLKVWQSATLLVEDVYRLTTKFPFDERVGLTAQLRRAAVSIPSDIGEGKRRQTDRAFRHHLDIALGSQGEPEVQLEIAARLGSVAPEGCAGVASRVQEVGRMLNGLIDSVERADCGPS